MPLYELYQLAKTKHDSKEINSIGAIDQSSAPENDFFELVWENGQISMQGQSSRARKSPTLKSLPSHSLRDRNKDVDAGLNEISMPVPSHEVDLSPDEDVMPWLNYTVDDSLQHEYSPDFLHELSGVTINDRPASNNFSLLDKKSNCNQVFRDSHKVSTSQLYPPSSHQYQTSFASVRSRLSDITENNTSNATQHATCGDITQIPSASSSGFSNLKMEKQDPILSGNSSTIMNFSHFARPAAIVKSNLQSIGFMSGLSSARSENMGNKNEGAAATRSNPPESIFVDSSGECGKESTKQNRQVMEPSQGDLKLLEPKFLEQNAAASKESDPACKEDASKIEQTSNAVLGESSSKGQEAVEKSMEPAVASSSVCSGNGAERVSDDPTQNLKRKSRDTEDSECHSEDVEEESVGIKKAAPARGMGSKRSRAAEVHNLSERRRRDRINEKMRALQELIPNCNKVDKASMLDEAIEYLKTLQLQVQIMSMGAGLYMPPMMFPTGMQHMHAPHMAPFSPMGVGMQMGLGMGYGMGMPDINGGSSRFPMVQVPQIQRTHLPAAHMSGPTALHGMACSNSQVFGFPNQGIPLTMPHAPIFSFSGGPVLNSSAQGINASGTAGPMETVDSASPSGLKDPMPNVNPQVMQNTSGCRSTSQMSSKCEATPTTVGFEKSALVHNSGHASELNDNGAVNPDKKYNPINVKSCEL